MVIVFCDRAGVRSWLRDANGNALNWDENIAQAREFTDAAAATAFLSGKIDPTWTTGTLTVTGHPNFGQKTHT